MGLFDAIANLVGSGASLAYQMNKDKHLTGAQQEANAFTEQQNLAAMEFSHNEAQQQMAFQERMANSQYQRGVQDMQAAGINPALAYSQGGAAAPSGASGNGSAGSSVDPGRGLSMSDMLQALAFKEQINLVKSETNRNNSTADKNEAETENINEQTKWISATALSQLGVNDALVAKYGAEVENLLEAAKAKAIENENLPALFEQQLAKGELDIQVAMVGMNETLQRIENLKADQLATEERTRLTRIEQGYVAAQIALVAAQSTEAYARADMYHAETGLKVAEIERVGAQTQEIKLDVWNKEFDKVYREMTGNKPSDGFLVRLCNNAANRREDARQWLHQYDNSFQYGRAKLPAQDKN